MDQTVTCVLLLLSLSATFGKYVYIEEKMKWHDAQAYCRENHTDLAPVTNAYDTMRLRRLPGNTTRKIWIGLERNSTDASKWTWSGGGEVSTFFWAPNKPRNNADDGNGFIHNYQWVDGKPWRRRRFFCYNVVVVRERKTWEEALEYCREHHQDLISVASDTEMLLIQKELKENDTAAHLWMGLRFLPGSWLWVDGQPLSYEAWGQEGKPECPGVQLRCAALQAMGGNTTAHGDGQSAWEARDCRERLHFLCY